MLLGISFALPIVCHTIQGEFNPFPPWPLEWGFGRRHTAGSNALFHQDFPGCALVRLRVWCLIRSSFYIAPIFFLLPWTFYAMEWSKVAIGQYYIIASLNLFSKPHAKSNVSKQSCCVRIVMSNPRLVAACSTLFRWHRALVLRNLLRRWVCLADGWYSRSLFSLLLQFSTLDWGWCFGTKKSPTAMIIKDVICIPWV